MTTNTAIEDSGLLLGDGRRDRIEAGVRGRIRGLIEEMLKADLRDAGDRLFTFTRLPSERRHRLGNIAAHFEQPIGAGVVWLSAPGHGTPFTNTCFTSSVVQVGLLSSGPIG
jgi:hypothetical protein